MKEMEMNYYDVLKNTITFHMSLGSKELFHSNFLQWLSVIDWDSFIEVLHKLAGINKFWWEVQGCNVGVDEIEGGNPQVFHPDNNNIEVRRECNHYDLSIYILTGYSKSRKWCPVFILENKVKSMPYQSQLNGYANKVVKEWEKNIKSNKKKKDIAQLWQEQPVTFVLLSLFSEVEIQQSRIIEDNKIDPIIWGKIDYGCLSDVLKETVLSNKNDLTKNVIEDYCKFIGALHGLSESDDWKVDGSDNYHDKIIHDREKEKGLRIADLLQKVHHERMLKLLEKKLKETFPPDKCKHRNKDEEYKDKNKKEYNTGVIFYETSFSRGTGITQAVIIINKDYRLMIQLQNNQYRKCLILHPKDKESEKELKERLGRIRKGLSKCLWREFGGKIKEFNSFGKFFKYKYELIDNNTTVDDILNKVVKDLENIYKKIELLGASNDYPLPPY